MRAIVKEIQIGGDEIVHSLEDACCEYMEMVHSPESYRAKMNFTIQLPDGEIKSITIRDEDDQTVAYGDFVELPSFLDYSKEE